MYRPGSELPHISWDAIQYFKQTPTATLQEKEDISHLLWVPSADSSSASQTPPMAFSFTAFADAHLAQNAQGTPVSKEQLEQVLAMVPAPAYGAPRSARTCAHPPKHNLLLVTPIVARHLQALDVKIPTLSALALISLRLPHIRSMKLYPTWLRDDAQRNPNFSWRGLTDEIRLPAHLQYLNISAPFLDVDLKIISLLPLQCPELQSLRMNVIIDSSCDLSPLLQLEHLTDLELTSIFSNGESSPENMHVMQNLTKLKRLYLVTAPDVFRVLLPKPGNALEEITIPIECTDIEIKLLTERAPQLRSLVMDPEMFVDWWLLDHTLLTGFQSLQTLTYGQLLCEGSDITEIGERCLSLRGSFAAHADHVISALTQLRCLTDLRLNSVYTSPKTRSIVLKQQYLRKLVDKADMNALSGEYAATNYKASSASQNVSASSSSTASMHLRGNSVYRLTAGLPQLLHLTLTDSAAMQLPSLSFLSNVPQLQSLSITNARYLPVESLYDLGHVSSSLTHLHLHNCFPQSSDNRPVFLLHDLLQPFQLSFPITQVATIKFPAWRRQPMGFASDQSLDHEHMDTTAPATFEFDRFVHNRGTDQDTCPLFRARHSSWIHIQMPSQGTIQSYRRVCDSFTVHANHSTDSNDSEGRNVLMSRLLPNLTSCRIHHNESTTSIGFIYDRYQTPQYRLLCGEGLRYASYKSDGIRNAWSKRFADEREKMHQLYGLDMSQVQEIDHWSYNNFIANLTFRE